MATSKKNGPKTATLWAYDVGFGDCLLLELGYASVTRFVLFDFGSKGASKKGKGTATKKPAQSPMLRIALDIERRIHAAKKGTLAAVIATHRHQDHISGFTPGKDKKGPGGVIARLKPGVVVQPWTDTPGATVNWRGPGKGKGFKGSALDGFGLAPGTLGLVHRFAELASLEAISADKRFARNTTAGILSAAGNNVPNLPAVKNLQTMCPAAKHDYVYAGAPAKNLAKALPGVGIQVLGPPTLHQYDAVFKAYAKKSPEYWSLRASLADEGAFWLQARGLQELSADAANGGGGSLFARSHVAAGVPAAARWLVARMDRDRGESLFELVRAADGVLNNTSVMLLLTIGTKRLLFPGDAQMEAWAYALKHAKNAAATRKELKQTDLYKVGHHGSLNATPKEALWKGFTKTGAAGKRNRLKTVMSTATGYFGGKDGAETEVPRKPLVKELTAKSDYHSTAAPRGKKGEIWVKVDVL